MQDDRMERLVQRLKNKCKVHNRANVELEMRIVAETRVRGETQKVEVDW